MEEQEKGNNEMKLTEVLLIRRKTGRNGEDLVIITKNVYSSDIFLSKTQVTNYVCRN